MYEWPARQCVLVTTGTIGASSRISPWLLSSSQKKLPSDNGEVITPLIMGLSVESSCVWASLITFFVKRHQVLISLSSVLAEDRRKKTEMD